MLGMNEKLASTKRKMVRMVRFVYSFGKENPCFFSPTHAFAVSPCQPTDALSNYPLAHVQSKAMNLRAYTAARKRMHEIETQKAVLLMTMRHERWKLGGPQ